MKAALLEKEKSFKIINVPIPKIQPDEVLIEVRSVAICGSEIHAFFGKHPFRKAPVITGHEFSGIISEIGQNVNNLKKGMRVTIEPQISCGKCFYCKSGKYNVCPDRISLGTKKWQGPFGNYIVSSANLVIPFSDKISFDTAALIEPLAVGVHALKIGEVKKGDNILILGAGMIGLSILMSAKFLGVTNVIITDLYDYRLGIAKYFGAKEILNSSEKDVKEELFQNYKLGADIVFIATGNKEAYMQSPLLCRRDGKMISVGLNTEPCIRPSDIGTAGCERKYFSSNAYIRDDFKTALELLEENNIEKLISEIRPIEDIQNTFSEITSNPEKFIRVILKF